MKLLRKVGSTSEIWQVFIRDSSSGTGAGLTGLAFGTSGLTAYYHRDTDTTATAISLVTMTVGTFTSSGFKEIDATNMPGWYQLCPPNAALATGAKSVGVHMKGATNMVPLAIEVDLDGQVDVSHINSVAASSVTTINANIGTTQPTNFTGTSSSALVKVDVIDSAGVAVVNSDFTIASATSSTVTLPTTYTDTTTLPDDSRYVGAVLQVVAGTGQGQLVILTTAGASARQYNVFSGSMPVQLDNTSKCIVFQTSRARADLANVTVGTNNDKTGYSLDGSFVVAIAAAVLDTSLSGHTSAGTLGGTVFSLFTDVVTNLGVNIAGSVWDTTVSGHTTSGTFGSALSVRSIRTATAAGGASTTITLDGSASATNNIYNNCLVQIIGATGVGQVRRIRSYVGSSKVATVSRAWTTNPDNTSIFAILPDESAWEEIAADHATSGTTGATLSAAGSAGDPWTTVLPGAYGAGTAGFIVGTNINATISSRLAPTTAGRTLDVTTTGEAGIDWGNIGTPGATVSLSATTVSAVTTTATATTVTTVNGLASNVITAASIATDAGAEIAAAVWDLPTVGHTTSGTFGSAMNAAGSAGDPWATVLPGSYGAGTAGFTVGTSLPGIAAGSANGLLRAGTNAATTFATFTIGATNTVAQTGDSFARLGEPVNASISADVSAVKTDTTNLVARIPAALFSGITSLAQWLGLLAGKQSGSSTARNEIRATGVGSGSYDETTDSQEAIRDRGDFAWGGGGGGGSGASAEDVWTAYPIEGAETPKDLLRLFRSVLVGATTGVNNGTQDFMSADEGTVRVTGDVGANGSRANVVVDPD